MQLSFITCTIGYSNASLHEIVWSMCACFTFRQATLLTICYRTNAMQTPLSLKRNAYFCSKVYSLTRLIFQFILRTYNSNYLQNSAYISSVNCLISLCKVKLTNFTPIK